MKCVRCARSIDSSKPPFGAYICKNGHAQCAVCEIESSNCLLCSESTKYKSPHFPQAQSSNGHEHKNNEPQVPKIRHVEPSEEEEKEFQRLRHSFTNGLLNELMCLKKHKPLKLVRTFSAIMAKDLYTPHPDKGLAREVKAFGEERYQEIYEKLRESGCGQFQSDSDGDSEASQSFPNNHSSLQTIFRAPKIVSTRSSLLTKLKLEFENENDDHYLHQGEDKIKLPQNGASSLNMVSFKSVSCLNLMEEYPKGLPLILEATSLDRRPFQCSIDNCGCKIFISDFNQHIISDHPMLPLANIKLGQFKELRIDIDLSRERHFNSVACFLMHKIVKNFGKAPLQDVLPMILMTGRHRLTDDMKRKKLKLKLRMKDDDEDEWTTKDFLMIWLAGIVPEGWDIFVAISVFGKTKETLIRWYVDSLNPIQDLTRIGQVYNNTQRLLLNYHELKMLTNNFQEQLQCQIGIVDCVLKKSS